MSTRLSGFLRDPRRGGEVQPERSQCPAAGPSPQQALHGGPRLHHKDMERQPAQGRPGPSGHSKAILRKLCSDTAGLPEFPMESERCVTWYAVKAGSQLSVILGKNTPRGVSEVFQIRQERHKTRPLIRKT